MGRPREAGEQGLYQGGDGRRVSRRDMCTLAHRRQAFSRHPGTLPGLELGDAAPPPFVQISQLRHLETLVLADNGFGAGKELATATRTTVYWMTTSRTLTCRR